MFGIVTSWWFWWFIWLVGFGYCVAAFVDSVGIPTISVCLGFGLLFVNALLLWCSVMFCCDCSTYVGLVLGYLLIQIISVVFGFCNLLVVCRLGMDFVFVCCFGFL